MKQPGWSAGPPVSSLVTAGFPLEPCVDPVVEVLDRGEQLALRTTAGLPLGARCARLGDLFNEASWVVR